MRKHFVLFFSILFSLKIFALEAGSIRIYDLRCNNMINPLGIERVSLSWKIKSEYHGTSQSAWQIEIADSKQALDNGSSNIWNSGKVKDDRMFDICPRADLFKSSESYWWRVRIWNENDEVTNWSQSATFSMGLLSSEDWNAEWITFPGEIEGLPYMRKVFRLSSTGDGKKLVRALAYVSGLGNNDFYVNGSLVDSTRVLDPAQTNYEHYALYSTYDITDFLQENSNSLGVMLSNGWFNQDMALGKSVYGRPMLKLQVNLKYDDGTVEKWVTDETWECKQSPLLSANIYKGEIFDARLKLSNWCLPNVKTDGWIPVIVAKDGIPPRLFSQQIPPIRMQGIYKAKKMWKYCAGKWIYDFGVNSTGNIRLKVDLPRGTQVTVTMSEELLETGGLDYRSSGIRVSPIQTETYICSGKGSEIWIPRNAYHGFRYAELSFSDTRIKPETDWLEKIEYNTDLEQTGTFLCDNEQLNTLHEMALRTFISNMQGVPIDCPHREKCGWLGDVHAYIKMCLLNYDMNNFLVKYMDDIQSGGACENPKTLHHLHLNKKFYYVKKEAGIPYMIAPGKRQCGVASPDWGTALIQIPWYLYVYTGNRDVLARYYDFMKQWTDYVSGMAIKNIVYQGLGDWCGMRGTTPSNSTPVEFTSSAFHYLDLCIMSEAAKILGKKNDAKKYKALSKKVKDAIINRFYHPLLYTFGTQTADAMALDLGILPDGDESKVASSLMEQIKKTDNFFRVGIFGIGRIGSVMSRNGLEKEVYNIFTKKGNDSFAWMWEKAGATTLWEILPVSDEALKVTDWRSHSHPMQGGYDAWFYEDLGGIRPCVEAPGFKTVLLSPTFNVELNYVKAEVMSRYGKIKSEWKKKDKTVIWNVSIPVGSTAIVPENLVVIKSVNGKNYSGIFGLKMMDDSKTYYNIPSGNYEIEVIIK